MADAAQGPKYYSVSVRVQRTTVEDAYVLVPVVEDVLADPVEGEQRHLDGARVMEAAVRLAESSSDWVVESLYVAPHPVQRPRPQDRNAEIHLPAGQQNGD